LNKLSIFDTSVCTENLGDKIIMDSAMEEIRSIFGETFYVHLPTHDKLGFPSYKHIKNSDFKILCGTNLLSSNMIKYNQWKINLIDTFFLKDVVLLGVGWWQYQKKPNLYTKFLLKKVLSDNKIHSVRDSYTENQLKSIGISNVINTSCPTMWKLTDKHCEDIPKIKGENVLMTLTNYNKNPEHDKKLIDILNKSYKKVYFWIQAYEDYLYLKKLNHLNSVVLVDPTLNSLDNILDSKESLDYVGTRLHAGIRAMNFKRRSIIIAIDNRATEKSKDFNINIVQRKNIDNKLSDIINSKFNTDISLPVKNINKWKSQFKESV
jgi:polysaccharide pyruvyl transferase WcaK-like protein